MAQSESERTRPRWSITELPIIRLLNPSGRRRSSKGKEPMVSVPQEALEDAYLPTADARILAVHGMGAPIAWSHQEFAHRVPLFGEPGPSDWHKEGAPPVTALPTRAAVATIPASTNVAPLKHTISAALEPRSVLETAREELWKAAYEKFREDQPESLAAYEALIVDQNDLLDAQLLVPETAAIIVKQQRERMESKQWTYSWFGAPQKVRDTAETVLKIVQDASDLVSVGMKAAPIYVSLPWSMITVLVPLIMNDFSAVSSAIDGLKEVASIMACYTYAEKEFLTSPITRSDFTEIVTELYSSILQYQACAAIYFGKSTLKRIGLSTRSAQTWPDAISKTRLLDSRTRGGLLGIQTKLTQHGFENLDAVMRQGLQLMQQVSQAVSADRAQRQQVMEWISMINPYQDHTDVLGLLGDQYSGSGQWLLSDKQVYLPWKSSTDGMLLLQGAMGQGKSSLTAMVIGDVLATSTNAVAFAYCSENASPFDLVRTARNKSINILRCLLAQCAILPDGTVAKAAQYAYDCSSRQKAGEYDANLGSLVRLLQEVILEHPSRQVTFVVDALDECSDRSELVTRLKEIARSGASVRIFVSARPHISISPAFDRRTYQTVIMESLNIDDIRSYVDVEVSKRYEISGMDPSQADRLRAALKRQADGMFRWVVLEIDLFLPKEDVSDPPADIERRLCNLEASKAPALTRLLDAYSDIYELALGKPDATSRRHCVQSAIDWALCCLKPLTVEDLVRTACVQSDGGPDIGLDGNTLLKYCSSLLIVTARGTIRLAHLSVRQFFEERKAEQFSKDHMHKRIALTSITVRRRTKDPHSRSGVTQDGREWLIDLNTGLSSTERYCFWNWSTHYRLSKTCSIAAAQMEHHQGDLVTPIDDLLLWTATVPDLAIQDSMGNTVLHRAIYDRRMDYVIALLHVASVSGSNDLLTKRNNAGKNALHLAALTAFAEAANLLLSTGADLMGVDACGLTALHLGVLSDCEALISSAGFDGLQATRLAAATLGGNTLLHFAAFFDRDSRVRESLILGFGLDAKNVRDETALDLAKLQPYIVDADMVFAATAPSVVVSLNPLPQDENIICRYTATLLLTGDTSDEIFEIAVRRSLRVAARVVQEDVISRAWRLQEAVLAERLVIFGTEQVYWSCSAGLGSQSRMSLASRPPIRTLTVFLEDEREIAVDGILDFKLRRVFDYWYYLAHLNTNGKLTVSPGRLSTVAALASALSPYAESEYSAGLWNADIVRGLLWQSQLPRSHSTAGNSRYDAPSWSWASANGPISYSLAAGLSKSRKGGVSKTHRFAVLENNVHEDAPFSNVQLGSSIRVSSHSCRVAQLDPAILSKYDYFFDDASFGFLQRTEERLADVTLILLAPWTYTPEGKSRWAGLMISNERWQTVSDSYHRRGIFLGPACGTDLSAWKRREFVLV
ncbi:hypothetical protein B0A54_04521 [Friedmanniomyces endolithicus]|uniref:Uncharacterized protein n=1 Tax=Friedmanniomyces endolithicus TaxID=329885 RepID=A0A4U0V708_9PEZI|nr:hypothetical protein B0A54_04521 [Friedmanniomyces endolithicus]